MKASGSFDLVVRGVEVPRERTFIRGGEPSLDHALEIGAGVAGVTGEPKLADRPPLTWHARPARWSTTSSPSPARAGHPLQRLHGDAMAQQHAFMSPAVTAAVLMGQPPTAPGFR